MTFYKSLVSPLIEHVSFITLTLHETNHLQLECIQRAAVRKAYHWPGGTSTSAMYKKHHIDRRMAKAYKLYERYIYKTYHTNEIVREFITDYNIIPANSEGVWSHTHCRERLSLAKSKRILLIARKSSKKSHKKRSMSPFS